MAVPQVVLSIAGFDPSSGAGITADMKTAARHGCYAVTCITALTIQSTQGVSGVQPVDAGTVSETLAALANDFDITAVRVGMLASGAVAGAVADFLESRRLPNIVLDPVIRSSSGAALVDAVGLQVLSQRLMPLADISTPNVDEAASLAGAEPLAREASWEDALPWLRSVAAKLHDRGSRSLVITGGHLAQPNDYVSYRQGETISEEILEGSRIQSDSTHGTGCAFAMSVACRLALGADLSQAVRAAKKYVAGALGAAYPLGKGVGPINHQA